MGTKIDRLAVEGFRGITHVSALSLQGKSLLLFGENGTGKSSFIDALERLFTGRVSTLEGRMGVSTESHGANIRASAPPKVSVRFSEGSEYTLDSDVRTLPVTVKNYLVAAREPLYILRRRQILDFIESKPQERYELLRPFLVLSQAEEMETGLRAASQRADGEAADAKQNLDTASGDLAKAADIGEYQVFVSEEQLCFSLSMRLQAVGISPLENLSKLGNAILALNTRLTKFGETERFIALYSIRSLLVDLQSSLSLLDFKSFVTALQALRALEATVAKTFYEDVLQRGLEWIQTDWQGQCPLCETPWNKKPRDRDALVARVQARLLKMRELVKSREETSREHRGLLDNLHKVHDFCGSLRPKLDRLEELDGLELLEALAKSLQVLRSALDQKLGQISARKLNVVITSWHAASYATRLRELTERVEAAVAHLPSPDEIEPLVELRSLLGRTKELWQRQKRAFDQRKLAVRRSEVVSTMLRLAEEARKEEVQELFDMLSKDINDLYRRLHGEEGHGDIRLEVRPEVRGSVNLGARFYDRTTDPRAYYSDAHLDSLGLCVFLALRRWYRNQHPALNLLILDDVLTSVDTQHAVRTAELILREFGDYQILVMTHDRIWYEYLRDIQARCRVKGQFLNKVIHKWTLEDGPDLREPDEERERLEGLLADGEAAQIAAEAGRLFEHILQEMRYSLRLSVQAKRGEIYEIGEMWPAFYSALRRTYRGFYEKCRETLDALDIRWPVRNWVGGHFNRWASRTSRDVASEFGRSVCQLFDRVFCKDGRRFIEPSMTPSGQLSCRCGDLIYPVPGKEALKPLGRKELVEMTRGAFRDSMFDTDLYFEWKRAEMGQEND